MNFVLVIFTTILGGFVGGCVAWWFLWKTVAKDYMTPRYNKRQVHPRR